MDGGMIANNRQLLLYLACAKPFKDPGFNKINPNDAKVEDIADPRRRG